MINDHINLSGKTAIVTGASRGIGEAAIRRLAKAGANVVLLARSQSDISRIAQDIGESALALPCDVSNWQNVSDAFNQAIEKFGSLDILVNNAGTIDPVARIEDADPLAWGDVVDVNVKGVFHGIRAAIPLMKRNGGIIVNISSGAASNALEGWSHYCSTKAAVLSLTQCVHKENEADGIHCVGLSPGTVATQMQRSIADSNINPVSQLDWSTHISPETAAEAIVWLCTDDARTYDGGDFSIKTPQGRAAVGLPAAQ